MVIDNHGVMAQNMIELAQLAMNFSRIKRTGVCHADGTPETDADHTIMLTWLAPALAQFIDSQLNPAVVAEMAAVHDAVEVYAGDTPTINISDVELQDKYARERTATRKLFREFYRRLPRFATAVQIYEDQQLPEARFVRAVDKLMPKLVHVIDGCVGVRREGVTRVEFREMAKRQREAMAEYAAEWPDLFILHITLCERVLAMPEWDHPLSAPQQTLHQLHLNYDSTWMVEHHHCTHEPNVCPFTLAAQLWHGRYGGVGRSVGVYRMELDDWGALHLAEVVDA